MRKINYKRWIVSLLARPTISLFLNNRWNSNQNGKAHYGSARNLASLIDFVRLNDTLNWIEFWFWSEYIWELTLQNCSLDTERNSEISLILHSHEKMFLSGYIHPVWIPSDCEKKDDGGSAIPPFSAKSVVVRSMFWSCDFFWIPWMIAVVSAACYFVCVNVSNKCLQLPLRSY